LLRSRLADFLLGAAAALAMPPLNWWWALFVSVPLFLFRFGSVTTRAHAFRSGWMFGFGYFCLALHWIGFAFLVDAKTYLWMMPFAVGGLAAVMALYWGLAGLVAQVLARRVMPPFFGFPIALSVCEWLRGHLMTGFPWAVPGLTADGMGGVAQLASITGMTGLTLLVLLSAAAPFAVFAEASRAQKSAMLGALLVIPVAHVWGQWRLMSNPPSHVEGADFRIVQPNLSQDDKWRNDNASRSFDELVALSIAPSATHDIKYIVWPESAVAFLIDESEGAKNVLRSSLREGQFLLTGSLRRLPSNHETFYTSIIAFDHAARIVGVYDKWRLVPGGEFLPFSSILEPLGFQRVVSLPGGFTAGTGPGSIELPGLGHVGMLICYEVAFPHQLVVSGKRPLALVNVTNDGWFGTSTGPYQHLAQVRLRAIEQGLPIIRSANTGISAVFDAFGRMGPSLGLNSKGVVDAKLPAQISATLYSRAGDWVFAALILSASLVGVTTSLKRKLS
jgi:apolipoprotein N-acyltransferase